MPTMSTSSRPTPFALEVVEELSLVKRFQVAGVDAESGVYQDGLALGAQQEAAEVHYHLAFRREVFAVGVPCFCRNRGEEVGGREADAAVGESEYLDIADAGGVIRHRP